MIRMTASSPVRVYQHLRDIKMHQNVQTENVAIEKDPRSVLPMDATSLLKTTMQSDSHITHPLQHAK
jgi:hypothetical protein